MTLGRGRVVVQHVADVARFPASVADRVAGVGHFQLSHLFDVGVDNLGEASQQATTVGRRYLAPRDRGLVGLVDNSVDAGDVVQLNSRDYLFGSRV